MKTKALIRLDGMITLLSKDQEEKLKGGFAEISVFPLNGSMEGQKNKKNVKKIRH